MKAEDHSVRPQEAGRLARLGKIPFRLLGIDVGSGEDADPDILVPSLPRGLTRLFEWDSRLTFREDGFGLRGRYRDPAYVESVSFRYKKRVDLPAHLGLSDERDDVYGWAGQTHPSEEHGFILGSAVVFNPFWGVSVSYDELRIDSPDGHFIDHKTVLALGYSPLGSNEGKRWNYSIEPALDYERIHAFRPLPTRAEGLGYSVGPVYYYGLDWVRIPLLIGKGKKPRLDRLKLFARISDSEIRLLTLSVGANITGYATRFVKLTLGGENSYFPKTGFSRFSARAGVSVRIAWSNLPF